MESSKGLFRGSNNHINSKDRVGLLKFRGCILLFPPKKNSPPKSWPPRLFRSRPWSCNQFGEDQWFDGILSWLHKRSRYVSWYKNLLFGFIEKWSGVCLCFFLFVCLFFPKQVYLWGSLLEKIDWTRCWARWAWLGADLALLGALGWVGRGVWQCWARWLGWAWCWACCGLGVGFGCAGRAGWVGRGVWPCWARWLGWAWCWACWARWLGWAWCWACWLGWAWCWAWGLGALAGLGVVLGVGFGRAGRAGWVGRGVGRGVWPCWARWLGWAWCWAWGLAVLGALAGLGVVLGAGFGRAALAGLGVVLGVGFGCAGRAGWVGRGVWPCWARWLGWAWCWACWARWLGWAWCWACWARWLGWACCWAWGLAALGALAGLGVVLGVGFGRAGRAGWVGRGFKVQKYTLEIQK